MPRVAVLFGERGAQVFVAGHQAVQRGAQGRPVEPARQAQRGRHMVGGAGRMVELVEEPQALLGERERQRRAAPDRSYRAGRRRCGPVNQGDEGRQRRLRKQFAQADVDAELIAQARDQAHRLQRVAAEPEKMVVAADPGYPQQFGPHDGDGALQAGIGRCVVGAGQVGQVGRRQRPAIELAVGRQRIGVQGHEGARQHVGRQAFRQRCAQDAGRQRGPGFRDQVGDQAFFAAGVGARQHHRFMHAGAGDQLGFDLAELDTETADFDLKVVAA